MMTKRSRLDEAGACGTVAVATEGFPLGTTATSSEHVSRSKALSASATATLHTGSTSASSSSSSLTSMSQQPATGGETVVNPELIALAPVAAVGSTSAEPQVAATPQRSPRGPRLPQKIGRWSLDEKILFLYGLKMYGKGRWKRMSKFLPDRSLVQIKSHGQKVLKRLSQGEHIFRRLEENIGRLQTLLNQLNLTFDPEVISSPNPTLTPSNKRKREDTTNNADGGNGGHEHIIAASALCQLATPGTSGSDATHAAESQQQQQALQLATISTDANALLLQAHLLGVNATSSRTSVASSTLQQQQVAAVLQQALVPTPASVQRQLVQQQKRST